MAASGFIKPSTAVQHARHGLDGVADRAVTRALRRGKPGRPTLVLRLDGVGEGYYLIPWRDSGGVVLVVQVDARTGAMLSSAALPAPVKSLGLTADQARRIVQEQTGLRAASKPRLVWQPCRESASPLQPLYEVVLQGGRVFVCPAGVVHRRLTPFGKGG